MTFVIFTPKIHSASHKKFADLMLDHEISVSDLLHVILSLGFTFFLEQAGQLTTFSRNLQKVI